ncbi:hypothetical protein GGD46_004740 [Rhizobium lusitanum]|uniref:Uncharacterized protein n=1 Tax=Rhizobium lusitanum TaxID=293958 RepID=A0A7X0IVL4_9HYPH|nr:hypothetical protein [Rhizobium lusitanum]
MIGVAADRHAIGAAKFFDGSTDDQFEPGIIAQNRQAVCAMRLNLGQAEDRNEKIPCRSDIGNVKIQVIQSHHSSKRFPRESVTVKKANANAGHSATIAKFRVAGSHAYGEEQSFRMEGVGPTETDPAFFDEIRLARNLDGSKTIQRRSHPGF